MRITGCLLFLFWNVFSSIGQDLTLLQILRIPHKAVPVDSGSIKIYHNFSFNEFKEKGNVLDSSDFFYESFYKIAYDSLGEISQMEAKYNQNWGCLLSFNYHPDFITANPEWRGYGSISFATDTVITDSVTIIKNSYMQSGSVGFIYGDLIYSKNAKQWLFVFYISSFRDGGTGVLLLDDKLYPLRGLIFRNNQLFERIIFEYKTTVWLKKYRIPKGKKLLQAENMTLKQLFQQLRFRKKKVIEIKNLKRDVITPLWIQEPMVFIAIYED